MSDDTRGRLDDESGRLPDEESTGNAELDRRLAEPILKGNAGLDKAQVWAGVFLIAMFGIITYSGSLSVPFHHEDRAAIVDNAPLHHLTKYPEALDARATAPLAVLSHAINWWLTPGSPAGFHAVNAVIHALNGVLVFLVCRLLLSGKTRESVAMVAGMLFALHPVVSGTVACAVGRSEILGTFFSLLSILAYARAFRGGDGIRVGSIALSVVMMALAWGCNSAAVIVPALVLAVDWTLNGGQGWFRRLPVHVAYWFVLATLLIARRFALTAAGVPAALPHGSTFLQGLAAAGHYARVLVAPVNLTPATWLQAGGSWTLGALAVVVCAVVSLVLIWRRSALGVALLWVSLALSAATVSVMAGGDMPTDRVVYFALAGAVIVIPWVFGKLPGAPGVRAVAGVVCACLILVSMAATFNRLSLWQDEVLLWADATEKSPMHPLPQRVLGATYLEQGEGLSRTAESLRVEGKTGEAGEVADAASRLFGNAESRFRRAVELEPGNHEAVFGLGMALGHLGKRDEAVEQLMNALREDVGDQECTVMIARLVQARWGETRDRQDLVRAVDYFARAASLGELARDAQAAYALALADAGRFEEAGGILTGIVAGDEASPFAPRLKEVDAAVQNLAALENQVSALVKEDPRSPKARLLAAQAHVVRGHMLQASYVLDGLLRENPADMPAWILQGYVRAAMGGSGAFLKDWPSTPPAVEGQGSPWAQLALMCASSGYWDAALEYLSSVSAGMSGLRMPLFQAGVMALQLRDPKRGHEYLLQATKTYPDEFAPWLVLCDMALAGKDHVAAGGFLAEAEKRGAAAGEVAKRRASMGAAPDMSGQSFDTVIR